MKLYFAATEDKRNAQLITDMGGDCILQSAYSLHYKKAPNELNSRYYLLDSGGFSAIKHGIKIDVNKYADYINRHEIKVAFNLDVSDTEETLKNQKYLEKNTKAYIIPVYHYTEFISSKYKDLIHDYAKDYPFISCGTNAEQISSVSNNKIAYLDYVYWRVGLKSKIHGLGATSLELMKRYPFYSVDSSSWLNVQKFADFIDFKNGQFIKIKSIKAAKGLHNSSQLLSQDYKLKSAIGAYLSCQKYITEYWIRKGVSWNETEVY